MENPIRRDPSYEWTAQEIEARLGCSTIVFSRERLLKAEDIAQMREAGITRIEVCALGTPGHIDIHDRAHISQVISECEKQGISVASMHSPAFPYNSEEEDSRENAAAEGVLAAKVAEDLGARVMVCHLSPDEQSEKSVTEMLDQLHGHSVKLGIENLDRDLPDYMAFVDKIASDRFGMVVDIGHPKDEDKVNPFVKENRARDTLAQCGKRLIHLHLHDWVDGDHVSPLDGSVQWAEVFAALKDIDYQGVLMFEAFYPPEKRELSPEYVLGKVASFPEAFVDRYVTR